MGIHAPGIYPTLWYLPVTWPAGLLRGTPPFEPDTGSQHFNSPTYILGVPGKVPNLKTFTWSVVTSSPTTNHMQSISLQRLYPNQRWSHLLYPVHRDPRIHGRVSPYSSPTRLRWERGLSVPGSTFGPMPSRPRLENFNRFLLCRAGYDPPPIINDPGGVPNVQVYYRGVTKKYLPWAPP